MVTCKQHCKIHWACCVNKYSSYFFKFDFIFFTGVNFINCEEKSTGEEHLQKCLEFMEDFKLTKQGMGIYHDALNQMGILWTGRGKPTEALEYFKTAELLYIDFKNLIGGAPVMAEEYLSPKRDEDGKLEFERASQLESLYTHTLFYFAQVHQQLGNAAVSAQYCHVTLQRQLEAPDLDSLDWSLHAATLSQYYMTERMFNMSRHCLASADVIYSQAEADSTNTSDERKEKLLQAKADILRCWIKYGLGLMEFSREKMLNEAAESAAASSNAEEKGDSPGDKDAGLQNEPDTKESNGTSDSDKNNKPKKTEERFNLEVTFHEEKISDKPLRNFEEAREVFLLIKKWIDEAKEFYKLDLHCPDHVAIVQDQSLSFKFLAFFELDLERQCKMHKRRIDMLVEVLNELNPQYYLLICRQLMFEVADTYSTMMDLKFAILEASGESVRPTPHHVKKINSLVKESIKYYQEYLDTLKGGKPVYPDEFPSNDVRPGLVAMFCMGRLYSKYIVGDVQARLMNIKKSKDCYQFVVDYCKKNPSAVHEIQTELEICQEMVDLLPAKMEKIRIQSEM